jgi:hypothetical protein
MITFYELKDKLLQTKDPDELVELLDISSEELLDKFEDKIEERRAGLCKEFENEENEN